MQRTLLKNKRAEVSIVFIVISIFCLLIAFYVGDKKTALVVFGGYAFFKIIANIVKRKRDDTNSYY